MRALKYRLASGEIVSTMAEAKGSGMRYEEVLVEIKPPMGKVSPKRTALLGQFGVVR